MKTTIFLIFIAFLVIFFAEPKKGIKKITKKANFFVKKEFNAQEWLERTQNHTLIPKVREKFKEELALASSKYEIGEDTIIAMIIIESSGNPSSKGDGGETIGLMGVNKLHARKHSINPKKLFEPSVNIMLGTEYVSELYGRFGNMDKAIVGYNTRLASLNKMKNFRKNIYWQKVMILANYS